MALRSACAGLAALAFAACGVPGVPTAPSPPAASYQITISPSGTVIPDELSVPLGARVLFVNTDSRRHDMTSDSHPDHQDCPAINSVGLLMPGQRRETGNLTVARTCGFHDHEDPGSSALRGRIVIGP